MGSKLARTVAIFLLAICFVCPLVEMFDHWDHTIQTGNDSEYALVILALCVGAAYTLARLIVRLSLRLSSITVSPNSPAIRGSLLFFAHPIALDSPSGSSPLNLRI
jgi:hypothetical protein